MTLYEKELAQIQGDLKRLKAAKEEMDWAESLRPITDFIDGSSNSVHLNAKKSCFTQVAQELEDRGFVGDLCLCGVGNFVSFRKAGLSFTYYTHAHSSDIADMAAYGNWDDDRCYTVSKKKIIDTVCGDNARLAFEQGIL